MTTRFHHDNLTAFGAHRASLQSVESEWRSGYLFLILLIAMIVFGNSLVVLAVVCDRKLRTITTNKFIASLAVSDLLVGIVVMPLSLYAKVNNDRWDLGHQWCQFHLVTGVFSTTASIVHLVAISLDRYFAIMFPTEYQRHSVSTSAFPYVVMIWLMSFAVSSTIFMEKTIDANGVCWVENPQYLVLSSILSFFLPGAIVVFLYLKIFRKLRSHQLYMFGQNDKQRRRKNVLCGGNNGQQRRSLPRVIIEEVRSRRGSRLSQTGSNNSESPTRRSSASGSKSERSPSQPDIHTAPVIQKRWRSPTICAETLEHDRSVAAKKRVSIVPDPPSMDISQNTYATSLAIREEHLANSAEDARPPSNRLTDTDDKLKPVDSKAPIPYPIIAAFHKAYDEISKGDDRARRLPLINDLEGTEPQIDVRNEHRSITAGSETALGETLGIAETPLTDSDATSTKPLLPEKTLKAPEALSCIRPTSCRNLAPPRPMLSSTSNVLTVPTNIASNTPPLSPAIMRENTPTSLTVPKVWDYSSPSCAVAPSVNSSHSSHTSASDETLRRVSMHSYGSSLTDGTDSTYEIDSRRSSAWSTIRTAVLARHLVASIHSNHSDPAVELDKQQCSHVNMAPPNGTYSQKKMSTMSRGKLRRIARQVTRAIRRKRRESLAIRRESRATRVVAAILTAFLMCWIPYFCITVYRGMCTGMNFAFDKHFHMHLYVVTSWLGYAHSCFNPVIYTCLNRNFRRTLRKMVCFWCDANDKMAVVA
ncbi:unnamed protein product [Anisakis simplex]|uniref:G_PROTEIN_RECEP_F1_2 domain-containing protein n=1 Tax=Anisakis simplex TaxID=6269 RepID=A0A0M3JY68_ANISI|nr:unnamed protein product [Anisakis simplex]